MSAMTKQTDMLTDPTGAGGLAAAVCGAMDPYMSALQDAEKLIVTPRKEWSGTADIFVRDLEESAQSGSFLQKGRDPFNLAACAKDFYGLLPEAQKFALRPMFTKVIDAVKEEQRKAAGTDKEQYVEAWAGIILDRLASFGGAREIK